MFPQKAASFISPSELIKSAGKMDSLNARRSMKKGENGELIWRSADLAICWRSRAWCRAAALLFIFQRSGAPHAPRTSLRAVSLVTAGTWDGIGSLYVRVEPRKWPFPNRGSVPTSNLCFHQLLGCKKSGDAAPGTWTLEPGSRTWGVRLCSPPSSSPIIQSTFPQC